MSSRQNFPIVIGKQECTGSVTHATPTNAKETSSLLCYQQAPSLAVATNEQLLLEAS